MAFVNVASFSEQKFVTSLKSVHVRVGLMADLNCPGMNSVLPILSKRGLFNGERYRWFLYGLRALEENRTFLQRLNITVSSNVLMFLPREVDYAILDVCGQWRLNGWYVSFLQIGSWSLSTGLLVWNNGSMYERRLLLSGMQLSGISRARTMERSSSDGGMQDERAYGLRLWNVLSKWHIIGITENLTVGYDAPMADFILEPVRIKQTDIHQLDYTAAVQDTQTILLFLHPNVDSLNNSFLRPFRPLTRLAIGALLIVFKLLMYKAFKFEQDLDIQQDRENGFLVLVLGILCQQGFIESSRTYASRLTLFSMCIFSMLLYQFYLTYIVSLLLVVPPKNIQTLKQLVQYEFGVALENVPETMEFLNDTEDKSLLTLVQTQLARTGKVYLDVEEGISAIQRGRSAFVCDAYRAYQLIRYHLTDEQRCALQEIPLTGKTSKHLALKKDHPLEEQFRITVQKIIGTSIVQYERSLCYADKPRCAENEVKMPEVSLDQVSSVLVLLGGTIIGSIAILLFEITVSKVLRVRH
ncbi:uncharacterized protein LOC126558470 [Anopheles maculipalpis]|uniref:uncharacterized protein LOC126558470 n=1 Tax=Anopheles maculipalpis TaxID=1496333 RepID=UPI002159080F|nr:uncharacterized protein LOC126558470 [Anopheles maculipalpis]